MLKEFLKEYDDRGLFTFSKCDFRQGARLTGEMGLEEGYTVQEDGSLLSNTVRIHTGVDRSAIYNQNGSRIRNVVYSPFFFNRSNAIFYGPKTSYGYLVQLFNDYYGFEMRIAHMNPDVDLLPEVRKKLENKEQIEKIEFLGQAGNFGISGGAHTHTEFLSIKETCSTFDEILLQKYGDASLAIDYTDVEIYMKYKDKALWIGKTLDKMKDHYKMLKEQKFITMMNKYKFVYKDPSTQLIRTRYSSDFLFNGL